jgi:hypothetical protein
MRRVFVEGSPFLREKGRRNYHGRLRAAPVFDERRVSRISAADEHSRSRGRFQQEFLATGNLSKDLTAIEATRYYAGTPACLYNGRENLL